MRPRQPAASGPEAAQPDEPAAIPVRRERVLDVIGDVHGCRDELIALMQRLGYQVEWTGNRTDRRACVTAPSGRHMVFVGDLVDRGPYSPDVLRIVMAMAARGQASCVPGNHDDKFRRWVEGRNVTISHGIDTTIDQFKSEPDDFKAEAARFLRSLPSHVQLASGALVVAHAGIREDMIGSTADRVRRFCLYGDTDGSRDANGLPMRYHWAAHYQGTARIIYGHTPVETADWVNNTICIDTGCCFGGALTALRWPEMQLVVEPARATYAERKRAFGHPPVRSVRRG